MSLKNAQILILIAHFDTGGRGDYKTRQLKRVGQGQLKLKINVTFTLTSILFQPQLNINSIWF